MHNDFKLDKHGKETEATQGACNGLLFVKGSCLASHTASSKLRELEKVT